MRTIDADWLSERIEEWRDRLSEIHGEEDDYVLCLGEVLMKIEDAPTVCVESVLHCKDCARYRTADCFMRIERLWELKPNDFCSQGGRKEALNE